MKFDLTAQNIEAVNGAAPEGTADGNFAVMPLAVMAVLNEVRGRITVAADAVANAVLALIQSDEQMTDTARETAALAAQRQIRAHAMSATETPADRLTS